MSNFTPNINLEKPLQSEYYNIDIFNSNFDKIDGMAAAMSTNIKKSITDIVNTDCVLNGFNVTKVAEYTGRFIVSSGKAVIGNGLTDYASYFFDYSGGFYVSLSTDTTLFLYIVCNISNPQNPIFSIGAGSQVPISSLSYLYFPFSKIIYSASNDTGTITDTAIRNYTVTNNAWETLNYITTTIGNVANAVNTRLSKAENILNFNSSSNGWKNGSSLFRSSVNAQSSYLQIRRNANSISISANLSFSQNYLSSAVLLLNDIRSVITDYPTGIAGVTVLGARIETTSGYVISTVTILEDGTVSVNNPTGATMTGVKFTGEITATPNFGTY
jgi:hypothetical protein